jgi:two-component system, cell cycle response regulator DivK
LCVGGAGFEVVSASDGALGVDLAGRILPQVILLDIQLPVMDGYAVASELRKNPALKNIPIVAVTSYVTTGNQRKMAIDDDCSGYISGYIEKPIDPETFVAEIKGYWEEVSKEHNHGYE